MKRLTIFLFLIGMFGTTNLSAQNDWEKNEQFFGPSVNDMIELSDGVYLFATSLGLAKGGLTGDAREIQSENLTRVNYLKLFKASDNTIWAGADANYGGTGTSLFKTIDNGDTWTGFGDFTNLSVQDITESSDGTLFVASTNGVLRIAKDSDSYETLTVDSKNNTISSLIVMPNGIMIAGTYSSSYWSEDNGDTWEKIKDDKGDFLMYVNSFTQFGDSVYSSSYSKGVFKSADGKVFSPSLKTSEANSLSVHDNKLYYTSQGKLLWTNDYFVTENQVSDAVYQSEYTMYMGYYKFINNNLFGIRSKVSQFIDSTWHYKWFGFDLISDFVQFSDGRILTQTSSHYLYTNSWGSDWHILETGFAPIYNPQNMVITKDDRAFVIDGSGNIKSSTNLIDWVDESIPETLKKVDKIEITSADEIIIMGDDESYNTKYVYGKLPSANEWTLLFENISSDEYFDGLKTSGKAIYVFYQKKKIKFRSSFTADVDSLLYDSNDDIKTQTITDAIYLGNDEHLILNSFYGVFHTSNHGESWEKRVQGIPNGNTFGYSLGDINTINDTLFTPRFDGGGIYFSTDSAKTWQVTSSGLDNQSFIHIEQGRDGYLYALSREVGLYRSTKNYQIITSTESLQRNTNFTLSQNFPNPFNPTTTIQFSLDKSSFTTLKVYDILGKEIATLTNGNLNSGLHSVVFDATKLASGLYFYRLESAGKIDTKKMLLIK